MVNLNIHEFIKLKNDKPSTSINDNDIEGLFIKVKKSFFSGDYKPRVNKCKEYISLHNIKPQEFIGFLHYIFEAYFTKSSRKGKEGAYRLIETLRYSKSFNSINYSSHGIKFITDSIDKQEFLDFLVDMKAIKSKYLNVNQKSMVKFIYENFDTPYTESYILRLYQDESKR